MARTHVRYEFGRINILPPPDDDKRSFLLRGLSSGTVAEFRGSYWSFLEIGELNFDGDAYVHGFLVKYERSAEQEVVDQARRHIKVETLENAVQAKARFVIHVPSFIIAFHPVAQEIARTTFIERFAVLFKAGHGDFFVEAEIQTVQDEYKILEALRRFTAVFKVQISLHPSNPQNREEWRAVDERLKALGATGYREEYSAKPRGGDPGVRAAGDPEIRSKIVMAEDGYGEAKVTGVLDDKVRTVTSKVSPITALVPRDERADAATVVASVASTVQRLLERFRR